MRLREMRKIVSDNLKFIDFNANGVSGSHDMDITNYINAINAINNLSEFKFIQPELSSLKDLPAIYYNKGAADRVRVDGQQYEKFDEIIETVKLKCATILTVIDESIPEEEENTVSVKLPEYEDLAKVSRFFSDLNSSLTMAFSNPNIRGKSELKTFESGSMWITIAVGSQIALRFLSNIAHSAMVVKKEYYEVEKIKLQVQAYGAQVQLLQDLEEKMSASLDQLVEAQALELKNKHEEIQNSDPEYTERLKQSITTIGKLFFEGAEMHKTLNAPSTEAEDIKFPEYPKLQTAAELKRLMDPNLTAAATDTENGKEDSSSAIEV